MPRFGALVAVVLAGVVGLGAALAVLAVIGAVLSVLVSLFAH